MSKMSDKWRLAHFTYTFEKEVLRNHAFTIIGGYDLAGAYCNWLIKQLTCSSADMIIDDSLCVYGVPIYRELALDDICPELYAGIVPNDRKYEEMFKRHHITPICLEDIFGCKAFGYYQYLEAKYGVDLAKTVNRTDFDYDYTFATNSGASRQMGLVDVIRKLKRMLQAETFNANVLDVGCGKGGAIELFVQADFAKVDGIELSKNICEIAADNMKKLGNKSEIMNVSATEFTDYAAYDILYMYDPFRDEVFRQAVKLYEDAARKRAKDGKRLIVVYANPYHHNDLVAGGVFKQIEDVDTDFFHRTVKIYSSLA